MLLPQGKRCCLQPGRDLSCLWRKPGVNICFKSWLRTKCDGTRVSVTCLCNTWNSKMSEKIIERWKKRFSFSFAINWISHSLQKHNSSSTDDPKATNCKEKKYKHHSTRQYDKKWLIDYTLPPGQSFLQVEKGGIFKKAGQSVVGSRSLWQPGPPFSNSGSQVSAARVKL